MNETFLEAIVGLVAVDSIGSIIARGLIWLALVSIVAIGTAKGYKLSRIKTEAGFFMLFIVLTGIIIYMVFGIIPTVSSKPISLVIPSLVLAHAWYPLSKTASYFPQT